MRHLLVVLLTNLTFTKEWKKAFLLKVDGAKYQSVVDENLLETAKDFTTGLRITFQKDTKQMVGTAVEWLDRRIIGAFGGVVVSAGSPCVELQPLNTVVPSLSPVLVVLCCIFSPTSVLSPF